MLAADFASPAEPPLRLVAGGSGAPALERARGRARLAVRLSDGAVRPETVFQSGSAKIRLPRMRGGEPLQAVFLNTAGGVTGGDRLVYEVAVGEGAAAVVSTQAAERIYRRSAGTAEVEARLSAAAGARLDWLPQETIVFDRSALARRLDADIAADATLIACEAIVLGRAAMGEHVREVFCRDAWRIRRAGRLVFADTFRIDGDAVSVMAGGAVGSDARALATLVLVAPDAESRLDAARAALEPMSGEAGASAWNGMLVARLVAPGGQALRQGLARLVETLRGEPMPRVWNC